MGLSGQNGNLFFQSLMKRERGSYSLAEIDPAYLGLTKLFDNTPLECAFAEMSPLNDQAERLEDSPNRVLDSRLLLH